MSGRIEQSSGNVFTDLGFPKAEAESLMLRSQLMSEVREIARGMTRAKAMKCFGIRQPRLNDVLRGKVDRVSLDALVEMTAVAGTVRGGLGGRGAVGNLRSVSCLWAAAVLKERGFAHKPI